MKDDLDFEEQTRGRKSREALSTYKTLLAPLVLADTMKNTALTKDIKFKDAWKKAMSDYPDSVFEHPVEGIDVITSHAPEFAAENPGTSAALGLGIDIADPISYGITKIASKMKLPLTLAQGTMKLGDKMADSGTTKWVQKLIDKRDRTEVKPLVDYIKKNKLRGELRNPEKLVESIEGTYGKGGEKLTEGTIDKVGQDIVRTTRIGDQRGAKPINRREIYDKMTRSVKSHNSSDVVSGEIPVEPYAAELKKTLKPFDKAIVKGTPPARPTAMPQIPGDDLEAKIMSLTKEADAAKKARATQSAQKAEREAAEKKLSKSPSENPKAEVEATRAAQKKEREAAERSVSKENEGIKSENDKLDKAIIDLLLKKKMAEEAVDPIDKLAVPKPVKGLPDYPAKDVLDIKLHNKKADIANRRYVDSQELKTELPTIEEQIAALKGTERKPLKEVEVPPPMPEEAFDVKPPVIKHPDVPPAIPDAATGTRDLESVLAELSDARAAQKKLGESNKKIAGENIDSMKNFGLESKAAAPREIQIDRISKLEDMWSLKKSVRDRLTTTDWNRVENLPINKEQLVEASKEIDDQILHSLKDINFKEGNAADIYRALNAEYGDQSDLLELAVKDMIQKWRGGGRKGGALPALAGGTAAALTAKMTGGNIPLSTVAGGVGGEAAKRGVFASVPEIQASIGDRLSKPGAAHVGTQAAIETLEIPGEYKRSDPHRELEAEKPEEGAPIHVDESSLSPEMKAKFGRAPQSEEAPVADPIDQKMSHVLMPEKPVFDPYVNEEVLNTFLPRDSKRILANPTALMAKMQQVAPNQVPVIQEMLDNDPDSLAEAGPKLAMMFPALFEKDKYGMFDGKIIDPAMQSKFLTDLADDEGMDVIKKANMAMKIHRGESIH
jgi:hypothetical protein